MVLDSIIEQIEGSTLTESLLKRVKGKDRLTLSGASRSIRAITTTAFSRREKRPLLVVVPTLEEAGRWISLLEIMSWRSVQLYPTSECSPYDEFEPTTEIIWGQLQVLGELLNNQNNSDLAIVTTERALQPHLPPKSIFEQNCRSIKQGDNIDIKLLSNELANLGYKKVPTTEQEGTWSRRGDIVDIYPVSNELPIRLELFDEELEKLREFDPTTQRSLDPIKSVTLTPTSFNPLIENILKVNDYLEQIISKQLKSKNNLNNGNLSLRRYLGLAWNEPSSLLDYIHPESFVVIDERKHCIAHAKQWLEHVEQQYKDLTKDHIDDITDCKTLIPSYHSSISKCFNQVDSLSGFDTAELFEELQTLNQFDLAGRPIECFPNQFGKISEHIKKLNQENYLTWLVSIQPSRAVALLEEHDCITKFVANDLDKTSINRLIKQKTPVALKLKKNSEIEGFKLPAWKIALVTDKEFFGQHTLASSSYVRRRSRASSKTVDPNKMQRGDYVVHRNHGIGRFLGMDKMAISGKARDYLVVEYLDGTLRVAADQLGTLGRFRANTDTPPKLNKMGGTVWDKTKEKARKSIQKVAIDLVKLYAERTNSVGFSYPPDGPWQIELEDSFPYEATPDQVRAVADVKKDMEHERPMDRLICGDVGFGKTEVAIRAIFKAITAGKQAIVLAPTTVLAQQHWRTIAERYSPYPIKVALLNRFKTTLEKNNIIQQLQNGNIDLVVGTHILLNKKITYDKLGLLVIDEEQRFGVKQKEKIKDLKKQVDVLTLSATPIPRTLYMSLSGVREMSLITTPPPLRRAIKTHLAEMDNDAVRSAIKQEIDRGGQVFYVVPRIEGIDNVAIRLKQMLPSIKLIVAHGQMPEGELESAMVAFNAGEYDVMLCTTIIESGLDIPRVNTILIEDSQKFGLSQLYQLRGRVGRSGVQAHAWLFYPNDSLLSDAARKRLRAIKEFTQLGSGYQLAMRDMEIRGVGNLLGVEQSGQMEIIGFDLYMEMLQECMAEINGQSIPQVDEVQIDLPVTAFIPGDWITEPDEKIAAYRSASNCKNNKELVELTASWTDRYGNLPGSVQALIEIMQLKLVAKKCGFSRIRQEKQNVVLETPMEEPGFRLIRKGIPEHLHTRFVYQAATGRSAKVTVRGIGVLPIEKLIDQLKDWLLLMSKQIPDEIQDRIFQEEELTTKKNETVLSI
ncbi:transcription-repair coupling factor [Prochlorococcus sp. MIT 1300]|uniref:transcription-repair coupling factor n=1 Tax=Prochlorococcus sp. MIT 1300 TaxID=3096218 RepID=UPI002A758BFA|nr:transcription-repair coupling factor [Prochlorococcus sp. MIT 1300]